MKSRDLALVAILLAIGAVLNAFMPNLGVITPDTVVTFSALAILLIVPKPSAGLGIGVVAGVLAMFFSKSSIAWFNILAHAVGALLATLVASMPTDLKIGSVPFKPALGSAAYGAIGGGIFITAMLVAKIFPFQVYLTAGWTQVLLSTLSSVVICMILYPPAKALLERNS
jgi:hypothetical protein